MGISFAVRHLAWFMMSDEGNKLDAALLPTDLLTLHE